MQQLPQIFLVFLLTAFVLILVWFALRFLKNIKPNLGFEHPIEIKSVKTIGQRERVVAVQFNGYVYLVLITPGGTSLLDKIDGKSISDKTTKTEALNK